MQKVVGFHGNLCFPFFLRRNKMSEKIFVHVNLLLSLGLGNLVYVLDKKVFTNRMEHPVSAQVC